MYAQNFVSLWKTEKDWQLAEYFSDEGETSDATGIGRFFCGRN